MKRSAAKMSGRANVNKKGTLLSPMITYLCLRQLACELWRRTLYYGIYECVVCVCQTLVLFRKSFFKLTPFLSSAAPTAVPLLSKCNEICREQTFPQKVVQVCQSLQSFTETALHAVKLQQSYSHWHTPF